MKLPKKITYSKAQKDCDASFSRYIRTRANNECELHALIKKLKLDFPVKTCNEDRCLFHIFPKFKGAALRYDEQNVFCTCTGLNQWEKYNRGEWYLWLPKLLEPERYSYLMHNRNEVTHRKVGDLITMNVMFKKRLSSIKMNRG